MALGLSVVYESWLRVFFFLDLSVSVAASKATHELKADQTPHKSDTG